MLAPANRSGIAGAAFWATDDIPSLTVGTSYSKWPAARLQPRARLEPSDAECRPPSAANHTGPAHGPHAIFVARVVVVPALLLPPVAIPEQKSDFLAIAGWAPRDNAAFETFSVLTRLPPPARRTPATVARLLTADFPHSMFLGA